MELHIKFKLPDKKEWNHNKNIQIIAQQCWGGIKYGSHHRKVNVNGVAQLNPPPK